MAGEDKSNEEENQQHTTSKLDVHLAVLFIQLGQSGWDELLADPRVGENHEQTADDAEIAQEEVEIKDETITETLCDDNSEQAGDGDLSVPAGDDQERADGHCNDVKDEERVRDTPGNWTKNIV